jgi:hypothetical protein
MADFKGFSRLGLSNAANAAFGLPQLVDATKQVGADYATLLSVIRKINQEGNEVGVEDLVKAPMHDAFVQAASLNQ